MRPVTDGAAAKGTGNNVSLIVRDEIVLCGDQFWVVRRRRRFGPFDYQWSGDLYGIELLYQGRKFGEVCNESELFADLKPFGLPLTVARVVAVTAGAIVAGIRDGRSEQARIHHIEELLQRFSLARFTVRVTRP